MKLFESKKLDEPIKVYFNFSLKSQSQKGWEFLTVLCGLRLAILRASSMAFSDGLQTIGVFGKTALGLSWAKCPMMSKIWEVPEPLQVVVGLVVLEPTNSMSSSSSETMLLWMGLRVSKHMIPSKQSSNPSLLSAFAAWTLSAFVKIYW